MGRYNHANSRTKSNTRFLSFNSQNSPEGTFNLSFEGGRRRLCLDCLFFRCGLAAADVELMHRLLQRHAPKKMFGSWLMKSQVRFVGSGKRVNSEKARTARILKRRVFCRVQMALVTAVDVSCYAWKPREPAGAQAQSFSSEI